MQKKRRTKRRNSTRPKTTVTAGQPPPEPDPDEALSLLMELLAIPGVSGREGQVAEYLIRRLRQDGVPESEIEHDAAHRRSPYGGEVGNLVCRLPGTLRGPRRMLTAHMDTVPLCEGSRPVRRRKWIVPADKHTGLGADDRTGCAVLLLTALEILRRKLPHPPLTLLWTVQEELGLVGARHVRRGMLGTPRLTFNFDGGSADKLTVGATGGYRMTIDVRGIASHAGAAPEEGVSAITIASLAIADLHREGWLGDIHKSGRHGTSNVGAIQGGEATNVVTDHVHLRAEARSHDPAFRRRIVRAIERAFGKAAREVRNSENNPGSVSFEGRLDYEAFQLADQEPCVLAAAEALRSSGGEPNRSVSRGGLDANWLTARGYPTVTLGCGQVDGHTVGERVEVPEYLRACQVALK